MTEQEIQPADLVELISGLLQQSSKPFYTTSFAVQGGNRYLDLLADEKYMNERCIFEALASFPGPQLPPTSMEDANMTSGICLGAPLDVSTPVRLAAYTEERIIASVGTNLAWMPFKKSKSVPAVIPRKIWQPSAIKVSLHAAWWGYTVYLPHKVMLELDPIAGRAVTIAASMQKVLQIILAALPVLGLTIISTAVIAICGGLAPFIGYISSFIQFSWKSLQSLDKGHGIRLQSTWILPIALIPRTWPVEEQVKR